MNSLVKAGAGGIRFLLKRLGLRYKRIEIQGKRYLIPLEGLSLLSLLRSPKDYYNTYEAEYHKRILKLIQPGYIVFDIGAHKGLYTIMFSEVVGSDGKVIAFEPNPETFKILSDTIAANSLSNAIPIQEAVTDEVGYTKLYIAGTAPGSSLQRFGVSGNKAVEVVTVKTTTIDSFVSKTGLFPDLLKIDVKGFELNVLRGASGVLERNKTIVCCEVHPYRLEALGASSKDVEAIFDSFHYELVLKATNKNRWVIYGPRKTHE